MKLAYFAVATALLQFACSGSPPAATEYKKQIGAVGGSGGGGGKGADATAGKTFLQNSCEMCHKPDGSSQIPLTSSEVAAIKAIASGTQTVSGHSASITDGIKKNEANIIAALGGDSSTGGGAGGEDSGGGGKIATGKMIVDTKCSACHGDGLRQPPLTKASADSVVAAGMRESHKDFKADFQRAPDIIAYLKSLP